MLEDERRMAYERTEKRKIKMKSVITESNIICKLNPEDSVLLTHMKLGRPIRISEYVDIAINIAEELSVLPG